MLMLFVILVKRLQDIGERNAIQNIKKILTKGKDINRIGDDCAAIPIGKHYLLVTTDMIFQRTHIYPDMTPYQMGWFLIAINLSDIAAKGGEPLGVVSYLGLPRITSESFLKQLTKGADACAVHFGTTIIGGDIKETKEITLCGTAVGIVKKDEFMSRIGGNPNDIVAVTGFLGKAGAGFYLMKTRKGKQYSKDFFEPFPRMNEGRLLAQQRTVTSSMDLSDGLSASLYQLQELNNVGFEIKKGALPLAPSLRLLPTILSSVDPYFLALHFGGDYELLVTISPQKFQNTKKALQKRGVLLTAIGRVTGKKGVFLIDEGQKKVLENKGYEHFKPHQF
jgi:thiamine-monophosphate kinase